ncbi:hypothetical protein BD410DRAFT_839259 [Rickenella mellea]|uniref:Ferritin-like domain-containing protein n=1 Tax=Rickenella mellea TaxID=50990 RepID=A0A4Y7Q6I3_9AGAM|nr:hypothetical protein BD410DRAFT_839259 [Rickenella mellea]
MLTKSLSVLALVGAVAVVAQQANNNNPQITDVDILNYALTLEHLEDAFYRGALEKFDNATFNGAGLNLALFQQISQHEASHVAFLTTALGPNATQACNYSFPYTDVKSFVALSMILEGVGTSAYLGAAALIQNKQYLTAAGSILTTEARHAAWISSSENGEEPWSGALDVPLSLNEVFSLAAPFIVSCPSTNPKLPVKAFPVLNVTSSSYSAGGPINLALDTSGQSGQLFVVFFSGLTQTVVALNGGSATIPSALDGAGTVYIVVTNANATVTDENTVAGPAILMFPNVTTKVENTGTQGSTVSGGTNASKSGSEGRGQMSLVLSVFAALLGAFALFM